MVSSLLDKKCVPCEGSAQPLTRQQAIRQISDLRATWELAPDAGKILCEFEFGTFRDAIGFVNKVADIAEREGHHPDIHISYSIVTIELWTHAIKGLSENDFILAAKIEHILGS
ncbi:MAG: 4a-hydroxytetrahydrobiopterin dehydratase [Patescibacteria group bacterium]|mgnify:CR=1 FL=1